MRLLCLLFLFLTGCSWPILRALPLVGETYETPHWEKAPAVSDPAFKATLERVLGTSFTPDNTIHTYINGDQIFPAMLKSIRSAKDYIYLESYIVWDGKVATEFAEALAERARAGVRVQLTFDWHGSQEAGEKIVKTLKDSGASLQFYHSLKWFNPSSWKGIGNLDNRTHRRLLVVDGREAFTGGAAFADDWLGNARNEKEWRDTHYKLEGPSVLFLAGIFSENWWSSSQRYSFDPVTMKSPGDGKSLVQVARSSPGTAIPAAVVSFSAAITAAQKSIRISTPYFIPEDPILQQLSDATKRGVKVELIVPGRNIDKAFVRSASRGLWGSLLKAGVRIFEYEPSLYHCKMIVVDDEFVSLGTSNWDSRSLRLNDEVIVNVLDPKFASEQLKNFEHDKTRSKEITYEQWRDRPIWERFIDKISGSTRAEL